MAAEEASAALGLKEACSRVLLVDRSRFGVQAFYQLPTLDHDESPKP